MSTKMITTMKDLLKFSAITLRFASSRLETLTALFRSSEFEEMPEDLQMQVKQELVSYNLVCNLIVGTFSEGFISREAVSEIIMQDHGRVGLRAFDTLLAEHESDWKAIRSSAPGGEWDPIRGFTSKVEEEQIDPNLKLAAQLLNVDVKWAREAVETIDLIAKAPEAKLRDAFGYLVATHATFIHEKHPEVSADELANKLTKYLLAVSRPTFFKERS